MYAFNELIKSLDGEVECRQDGSKVGGKHRAGYLFNSGITGIDDADAILLVGSNPRLESPVLNSRIRQRWLSRQCKIANVGPDIDLSYKIEQLGDNAAILKEILMGKNDFAKTLKNADKPMIILGQGALNREDSAAIIKIAHDIAEKYGMVSDEWNGFNVLHTAASRVAALDMGLVTENGIEGILDGAEKGDIKVVYNMGADEFDTSKLAKAFVIYQGSHGDEGVKNADVILPGVAYTEKPGTYLNTEGRVQIALRAIFGPGEAREDWTILRALSDVLGKTLSYDTIAELRAKMVKVYPHFAIVDQKPSTEWSDFGVEGDVKDRSFTLAITDFYGTNPIARSSETMAECRAALNGDDFIEGATGT